VKIQGLDGM